MLIFAAILAIFVYGMIAAMLGTILPDLSDRFHLTPTQNLSLIHILALHTHLPWPFDRPSCPCLWGSPNRCCTESGKVDDPYLHRFDTELIGFVAMCKREKRSFLADCEFECESGAKRKGLSLIHI